MDVFKLLFDNIISYEDNLKPDDIGAISIWATSKIGDRYFKYTYIDYGNGEVDFDVNNVKEINIIKDDSEISNNSK